MDAAGDGVGEEGQELGLSEDRDGARGGLVFGDGYESWSAVDHG